ncbi:hypothetical protein ACFW0H_00660 [Pseudomonas sp. CR3202]|uniref:hypothetical protein n=1 Tax=Pseudomonas sp. CR3202 TaxID=3351532 RepID=UPI003BF3E6BF
MVTSFLLASGHALGGLGSKGRAGKLSAYGKATSCPSVGKACPIVRVNGHLSGQPLQKSPSAQNFRNAA